MQSFHLQARVPCSLTWAITHAFIKTLTLIVEQCVLNHSKVIGLFLMHFMLPLWLTFNYKDILITEQWFNYLRENLSLGSTIKNVTFEISKTHPTTGQYRIHIRKLFNPNYLSKGYPSHVEFKTSIKFTIKCVLMWKMNAYKKKFKNVTWGIFFIRNTKGIYFLGIFLMLIILNTSIANYLISFLDNWLNQFLFSYDFLKSKHEVLEGHWCQ
jgi:hypothetical protein